MDADAEAVERMHVAPRALLSEEQLREPVCSGLILIGRWSEDRQRRSAALHVGGEDERRQAAAVVDVQMGEQNRVKLSRADLRASESLKHATSRVDKQAPAV